MQWLAWFALMAYCSMFCKLAAMRGDALLSSPSATLAQHARILALLSALLVLDASVIAAGLVASGRGLAGGDRHVGVGESWR